MRQTDTLGLWTTKEGYERHCHVLCRMTNTKPDDWKLVADSHQISTREAGKSGCIFFVKSYATLKEALAVLASLHLAAPTVNIELQLTPDGTFDRGDGPTSFKFLARWQTESAYIQKNGFAATLLVDAQNLLRV